MDVDLDLRYAFLHMTNASLDWINDDNENVPMTEVTSLITKRFGASNASLAMIRKEKINEHLAGTNGLESDNSLRNLDRRSFPTRGSRSCQVAQSNLAMTVGWKPQTMQLKRRKYNGNGRLEWNPNSIHSSSNNGGNIRTYVTTVALNPRLDRGYCNITTAVLDSKSSIRDCPKKCENGKQTHIKTHSQEQIGLSLFLSHKSASSLNFH
uniref:Uncharacterized protein n=1 Tax=Glossina austeni TaxID=7395 RepID=A0A1A9UZG4_GLOAU